MAGRIHTAVHSNCGRLRKEAIACPAFGEILPVSWFAAHVGDGEQSPKKYNPTGNKTRSERGNLQKITRYEFGNAVRR